MGGWDEEVWYSLYQVARLHQRLGFAWALVLDAYLRAYEFRPTRVEPIYQIARCYREHGQYHLGYLFSRAVFDTPYPEDLLFIEKGIYQHELALEYALCREQLGKRASAAGRIRQCRDRMNCRRGICFRSAAVLGSSNVSTPKALARARTGCARDGRTPLSTYCIPMHREHLARRIVVQALPSVPRPEVPFRAARCRSLRQPRWLPLQRQADAEHVRRLACGLYFSDALVYFLHVTRGPAVAHRCAPDRLWKVP